ncbi:hypothetical protein REPUB_Repub15cG0098700 [Reevesia pubescens]
MFEKMGFTISETLGEVIEIEATIDQLCWGKYLRVRIMINITKPLKNGSYITLGDEGKTLVAFKYERLSDLCYVCGKLIHHESKCNMVSHLKEK